MNNLDFTIVLCSRKREKYLIDCLNHIEQNSKSNLEVLIGCDIDDTRYLDLAPKLEQQYGFAKFVFRTRMFSIQDYLNFLALSSNSKYVFGINDDVNIISKCWDINAIQILESENAYYGLTGDNSIDRVSKDYSGAPIIAREAIKKLGWFMEPRYANHGSDVVTYRIYKEAGKIADLSQIVKWDHILHNSPEALKLKESDETNREMVARTFSANFNVNDLFTCDVSEYVRILNG